MIVSTFQRPPLGADDRWFFGILAGAAYPPLDKIQYETTFQPTLFKVAVSFSNSTIIVTPAQSEGVASPDPGNQLRLQAQKSYGLSYIVTSLYTSAVGEAFNENIRNLQVQRSIEPDVRNPKYMQLVQDAIADSVRAVMEDSLVALGSASLTRSNSTQTVFATATVSAVQIGSKPFIWAAFAINVIGLVGVSIGSYLLWRADVPVFEYCDIGCMAFGILQGVVVLTQDSRALMVADKIPWNGDARDERIGNFTAKLQFDAGNEVKELVSRRTI
jgi:hypothetical protein